MAKTYTVKTELNFDQFAHLVLKMTETLQKNLSI